jgi:hypothetical protein
MFRHRLSGRDRQYTGNGLVAKHRLERIFSGRLLTLPACSFLIENTYESANLLCLAQDSWKVVVGQQNIRCNKHE